MNLRQLEFVGGLWRKTVEKEQDYPLGDVDSYDEKNATRLYIVAYLRFYKAGFR